MGNQYLVSTGKLIKDYLIEYNISQKSLAKRTGVSEKHISNVLSGNSRLTEEFALKLEKVLPAINASYWLNYEAKYREYMARQLDTSDLENYDLKEISKRFRFKEIFKDLDLSLVEEAIEMLKLLKISNFKQFESVYDDLAVDFMEDGGEKEAMAIWLNLCENEVEIQNNDLSEIDFNPKKLEESLQKFKLLAFNDKTEKSLTSCVKLCNKLGINMVICEAITNSKVRGALTTYKSHPTIYISKRFQSHSHIWFAIMHEIAHLLIHYDKSETIITFEESNGKEIEANQLARELLITSKYYEEFVSEGIFNEDSIRTFAQKQKVLPCIVVGFLQHDNIIKYSEFNYI
ncbi:MAG: helix-turn-helix domain-containing protein [Clostridia bacterium]|nr:helix-turn-helix domain-containing protein [Clostridia bacterium]